MDFQIKRDTITGLYYQVLVCDEEKENVIVDVEPQEIEQKKEIVQKDQNVLYCKTKKLPGRPGKRT